ncbi:hypothetical protein V6N11_068866 [Hibiscus sabdariffa]|uniref:Uncharacterized protein n=1 Tax=Hibiscus sabdariffa TaxID=183260 RepID=A0ABR2PB46_9ROSI
MDNFTVGVGVQEKIVAKELDDLLRVDEKILYQKSRTQFLKEGIKILVITLGRLLFAIKLIRLRLCKMIMGSVADSSVHGVSDGLSREILGVELTPKCKAL